MSWTKTEHEGQIMWEQDGERVREVPDEPRGEVVERVYYRNGVNPMWIPVAGLLGWLAGGFIAAALELKL